MHNAGPEYEIGNHRMPFNNLIIIPARGGSVGIPRKNLVPLNGYPLLKYSVDAALPMKNLGLASNVIVSTDDEEIATVGRELGAEVPFIRPAGISGSKAKSVDFVLHALDFFEQKQGEQFDAVTILQPTSPLRTTDDLESALRLFANNSADSLISVYRECYINDLVAYTLTGSRGVPRNPNHNRGVRRQEHEALYIRNGAIYVTKTKFVRDHGLLICDYPLLYEMPKNRSSNIDTPEDLIIVEKLLQ
jgi:CMP-N,N'-diacetyllegionaminic acid synthase